MLSAEAAGGTGGAFINVGLAVMCLIAASYPVWRLIGWWIDGGAEPLAAMLSICLYMMLVVAAMVAPMGIGLIIFGVIVVSAIVAPFIGQAAENVGNQRIEDEHLAAYVQALEADPMDPVARIALAEALYKRGEAAQAVEHMTWTLEHFPRLSTRIKPQLDAWNRDIARGDTMPWVFCHICHAENVAGAEKCISCGAAFGTRSGVRQRIRIEGGPKVVIRGWIVTASTLCVILFSLLFLPIIVSGPIILGALIVGAFLFLRWVGGDMGVVETGKP